MRLSDSIADSFLRLDGAMGTQIQKLGLQGDNELLNLTAPEAILGIHRAYVDAGADILSSNSFGANAISQQEYGYAQEAPAMAEAAARLARNAADAAPRKVWVAGSMGPTSQSLALSKDLSHPLSFAQMRSAFRAQAEALLRGGADLLLLETCFDALNAKAALSAIRTVDADFPVIVSVSPGEGGRLLTGQSLEAFYDAVLPFGLTAFGLNCSFGAGGLLPLLRELDRYCEVPVICYPNAGLPDAFGNYTQTPAMMAEQMRAFDGLVNIAGGCCGTGPEHIAALPDLKPRKLPEVRNTLKLSGLEPCKVGGMLLLIGERTNVAGSRKFARLAAAGDWDTALGIAVKEVEDGASVIDINLDDPMLDAPSAMRAFIRCLENEPAAAKAALMIDSSDWGTVLAGLESAQGRCIVNSISLKDGEEAFLAKAREIRLYGAAMVVMAFDERGQATSFKRKIEICSRAYRLLTGAGIPASDIVFDVNVLTVATGIPEHDRYALDFIEAVRWIKANLPGARCSAGVSNLSFAFRGHDALRCAMHSVFLYHAVRAGLDMAIVNPAALPPYGALDPELREAIEDVLLCRRADASGRLSALAEHLLSGAVPSAVPVQESEPEKPLPEQLEEALLQGRTEGLEALAKACIEPCGGAAAVIEGPLMRGMEAVGERFGAGKMFLPQVLKSAQVMKEAVAVLEPFMPSEEGGAVRRPVAVFATVKGDVHDIGKNIAAIVLRCNGFDVADLGVMVENEAILEAAREKNAVLIGVSGLITPSLYHMEELCREMDRRGLETPLFVGGAATSDLHTAVKLAPLYKHVFHSADASSGAVMAGKYLVDPAEFERAQWERQEELRRLREAAATPLPRRRDFAPSSFLRTPPPDLPFTQIPLDELLPLFSWKDFQAAWGGKCTPETTAEAQDLLEGLSRSGGMSVRCACRFFQVVREGDLLRCDAFILPFLRQAGDGESLIDFLPSAGRGVLGLFALVVHDSLSGEGCNCPSCRDDYHSMLRRSVRVTLAEAASAWLDARLQPALPEGFRVLKPAAGYAACPDHSLKRDILAQLPSGLGIALTESCAMIPDASVCGFVILHPEASYPQIRRITRAQYESYAAARGFTPDEARLYLSQLL
ncbi:MAG: homocysteine S-methyltransferase family protein [Bacteroidales bacterium]|nr:homocysteine S-methyltransferase family protein [Bacteroidales bacterium]